MEPLHAAVLSNPNTLPNEAGPNPAMLEVRMHRRVEQECVAAAIPGHVDEADQAIRVPRAKVGEAMAQGWLEFAGFMGWPRSGEKRIEIGIRNAGAAKDGDIVHRTVALLLFLGLLVRPARLRIQLLHRPGGRPPLRAPTEALPMDHG